MAKPVPKPSGPPPAISGIPRVGELLTVSNGGWSGGPFRYGKQWVRGATTIEGAIELTYVPVEADVGEMILAGVDATNSAGTAKMVYSAPVGPIEAAAVTIPPEPGPEPPVTPGEPDNTLPPVVEPPPSGDAPASITAPVVGTPLPHVWALKEPGATGPREGFLNGVWSGELDAYLESLGFYRGNIDGALCCDVGDSEKLFELYDLTGAPRVNYTGAGRMVVRDVRYARGGKTNNDPTWPTDINNNINPSGTIEVSHEFCEFNETTAYQGSGETVFNHCKITGQLQGFCDISGNTPTSVIYRSCYIPGGGVQPPWAAHVELMRWAAQHGVENFFKCLGCYIDVSACGQANAQDYQGGWTGVWSLGDVDAEFIDSVMIGGPTINASPTVPNTMGCVVAFGDRVDGRGPRLGNCVLEPGCYGYSYNHTGGGTTRCTDLGGNRSLQNEALSAGAFASISRAEAERINPVLARLFGG